MTHKDVAGSLVSTVPFAVITKQGVCDCDVLPPSLQLTWMVAIGCVYPGYHVVEDERTSMERLVTSFFFTNFFVKFPGLGFLSFGPPGHIIALVGFLTRAHALASSVGSSMGECKPNERVVKFG